MQKLKTKKFKKLEIKTKKILSWDFFGNYKTLFKGLWIDFAEIREYFYWDSIKRIDWKTSAKQNKLFVKNYEQERDLKILFFLDIWKNMNFWSEKISKIDLEIQIFYILALSAIKSQDNVWVILFNWEKDFFIDYSKSEEIIIKTLNKIKNFSKIKKSQKKQNYLDILKKYKLKDNLIFILTDNLEFDKKIFRSIDLYNEIIYINIFDYFENNLSSKKFIFPFSWKKWFIDFSFWKNRENYINFRKEKLDNFKRNLWKNNIKYMYFDTKSDLFKNLMKIWI